jgi:hypothetical protein
MYEIKSQTLQNITTNRLFGKPILNNKKKIERISASQLAIIIMKTKPDHESRESELRGRAGRGQWLRNSVDD